MVEEIEVGCDDDWDFIRTVDSITYTGDPSDEHCGIIHKQSTKYYEMGVE